MALVIAPIVSTSPPNEIDAQAQSIFIILAIEEGNYRFWYRALAGAIKPVCRTNVITTFVKVIAECVADITPHFFFRMSRSCHKNSSGSSLCSLDAFRMIVCYLSSYW